MGMKSKRPATGLRRKNKRVHCPGADGHFYTLCFREERYKLFYWLKIKKAGKGEVGAVLG